MNAQDEYLINNGKAPITKIDNALSLVEVQNEDSYSYVLKRDEILVDIDNIDVANKVLQIIIDSNIGCEARKTERGIHFLFLQEDNCDIPSGANIYTMLGVAVDYKSGKRSGNECRKKNGVERELIYNPGRLDYIPNFLKPSEYGKDINYLIDELSKGQRNETLFRIGQILNNDSYPQEDITLVIELLNKYFTNEMLSMSEVNNITKSVSTYRTDKFSGKVTNPNELGNFLKNKYCIKNYNGSLYIYNNSEGFISRHNELENLIYDYAPKATTNLITQVLNYINVRTGKYDLVENQPHIIKCLNGLVNLYTGEMYPFTPHIFTNINIPVYYNPNADSSEMEKALMKYANYDNNIFRILLEFVAYIFFPKNPFKKVFILTGSGSNGKTVFTQIIHRFLGRHNCSALTLDELSHEFKVAGLATSLCNIGGDIGDKYLEDSSALKAITGNDTINANRKFMEPLEFECRSKLIFNCNKLPMVKDKSYALYNRLVIVPFTYDFDNDDDSYGFDLDEFCNMNNMSALLNLVIKYYRELYDNNKFTLSDGIINTLLNYMCVNDNVAEFFILQKNENSEDLAFVDYENWCMANNKRQVNSLTYQVNLNNISHYYKNLMKQLGR